MSHCCGASISVRLWGYGLYLLDLYRCDPGTRIGKLILKCECAGRVEDFMWIWGRSGLQVVVPQRVLDVLKGAGLTGYEAYRVRVTNAGELSFELPPLCELLVTGKGGPMGPEAGLRLWS